jgi:hypothetical protein
MFFPIQLFRRSKISYLSYMQIMIYQNIEWFDVSVAHSFRMNVGNSSQNLIQVHLYIKCWQLVPIFQCISNEPIKSSRHTFKNDIPIDPFMLIRLSNKSSKVLHNVWVLQFNAVVEFSLYGSRVNINFLNSDDFICIFQFTLINS